MLPPQTPSAKLDSPIYSTSPGVSNDPDEYIVLLPPPHLGESRHIIRKRRHLRCGPLAVWYNAPCPMSQSKEEDHAVGERAGVLDDSFVG